MRCRSLRPLEPRVVLRALPVDSVDRILVPGVNEAEASAALTGTAFDAGEIPRRMHSISLSAADLMFLEADNPERDIYLYINSPGGSVTAGLAIYDTMQFIKPDVSTMCIGQAASMGALLLAGGAKGKRVCLPHSRIMIHQSLGGFQGQATDIDIHARAKRDDRRKAGPVGLCPGQGGIENSAGPGNEGDFALFRSLGTQKCVETPCGHGQAKSARSDQAKI